ncbi:hypothetical protein OW492_16690 [Psychromonas sp. 14N.309.X.WAT.B.A12]|uniref:hypothetical protein n=1 Tax=Psychromonas sp. 14N.309.X.WAT.B.A12 TaxID=2998322 RepID=UPI0025AF6211|nr:hypothetical protein [Psychromonas sp. 14N.309.X.WAT.B.A12]MDN2665007.1 hypothetical protein [Psychromonas sp. 14N.309.X.WAT.B.A12]
MSKICSTNECERDVFENTKKCVLHCEKSDYSHDFQNKGILREFYDALIEYIAESAFEWKTPDNATLVNVEDFKSYLKEDIGSDEIIEFCKNETTVFNSIFFPCRDSRDNFDYLKILKKIKGAHFNYCKFTAHSIEIPEVETFYQDCEFFQWWSITPSKLLGNVNNVLYQQCQFKEDVSSYMDDDHVASLEITLFNDCSFDKTLSFENVKFKKAVFNNTDNGLVKIHKLRIENCELEEKFILNKLKSEYLLIKNSEFKSKIELKEGVIDEIELINTNFNGLFDSYGAEYGRFYCFKSIFSDFVGFEKCKFSSLKEGSELNQISIFKYVTLLSFTNFRNSIFYKGLDLEDTNLKEAPNFLNIDLLSDNTNRETLRIIKDSFDKIGNHIEANKFFVLEMRKYKQGLTGKPINQEKIIFWLNEKTSNFGQSYLMPISWIAFFSVIYYLLILGQEMNFLYNLVPSANSTILSISSFFNGVAENIIPFKKLLKEGMEFISLIFYVVFSSLVWQTIVAVKRHTRR